jgi:Fe-S-cluster containining protein
MAKVKYDCSKCPGYCCSYPRISVTKKDVRRLADHFGITEAAAWKKFIRRYVVEDGDDKGEVEYILKHRKDHIYATICQFFDQDERRCTIYEARPSVCREYPDGKVCGYYNFLKFERKHQDDKEFIPSA